MDQGAPVEHQENEKDTTLTAIRVKVKILQFLFGLQLPLTVKRHTTVSNPCNKVRGKYFYKEVFLRLLFIASVCILHEHVYENATYTDLVPVPVEFFKNSERT